MPVTDDGFLLPCVFAAGGHGLACTCTQSFTEHAPQLRMPVNLHGHPMLHLEPNRVCPTPGNVFLTFSASAHFLAVQRSRDQV